METSYRVGVPGLNPGRLNEAKPVRFEPGFELRLVLKFLDIGKVVCFGDARDERAMSGGLLQRGHRTASTVLVSKDGRKLCGHVIGRVTLSNNVTLKQADCFGARFKLGWLEVVLPAGLELAHDSLQMGAHPRDLLRRSHPICTAGDG